MAREGRDVISVCCMKNDVGNVVSDANDMKDIWSKYMEKLLNVENDWDGDLDCPEVMGPCCIISEEEVAAAQVPEKHQAKKKLYYVLVDLEKAFDKVPRVVMR